MTDNDGQVESREPIADASIFLAPKMTPEQAGRRAKEVVETANMLGLSYRGADGLFPVGDPTEEVMRVVPPRYIIPKKYVESMEKYWLSTWGPDAVDPMADFQTPIEKHIIDSRFAKSLMAGFGARIASAKATLEARQDFIGKTGLGRIIGNVIGEAALPSASQLALKSLGADVTPGRFDAATAWWQDRFDEVPDYDPSGDPDDPANAMFTYLKWQNDPPSIENIKDLREFKDIVADGFSDDEAYDLFVSRRLSEARMMPGFRKAIDAGFRQTYEIKVDPPKNASELVQDVAAGLTQFAIEFVALKKVLGAAQLPPALAGPLAFEMSTRQPDQLVGEQSAMYLSLGAISKIPADTLLTWTARTLSSMGLFGGTAKLRGDDNKNAIISMMLPAVLSSPGLLGILGRKASQAITLSQKKALIVEMIRLGKAKVPFKDWLVANSLDPDKLERSQLRYLYSQYKTEMASRVTPEMKKQAESVAQKIVQQMKGNLKEQKAAREALAAAQRAERGKRAGQMTKLEARYQAEGLGPRAASAKATKVLAGRLVEESAIPPELRPVLSDAEWDVMAKTVQAKFPGSSLAYSRKRGMDIIEKIRNGQILQENEILMARDMWGKQLAGMLAKQHPFSHRVMHAMSEVPGILRTVKAGGDISFAGRQMWTILAKDIGDLITFRGVRPRFATMLGKGIKTFFSKDPKGSARSFDMAMRSDPDYPLMVEKMGLNLVSADAAASQEKIAEGFGSAIARRWPLIFRGHQAQTVVQNYGMFSLAKSVLNDWRRAGVPLTDKRLHRLGIHINTLVGRPVITDAKQAKALINFLNQTMFSPRYKVSRFRNVFTLMGTLDSDPYIAQEGIRTLVGMISTVAGVSAIADALGATVALDPRDTKFGRLTIGNKHIDITGGHALIVRLIARMWQEERIGATGDPVDIERREELIRTIRSSASPIIGLISLLATGRKYDGRPVEGLEGWSKAMVEEFTLLWVRNAAEAFDAAAKEGDTLGGAYLDAAITGGLEFLGVGTQAYAPSPAAKKAVFLEEKAMELHERKWDQLTIKEKAKINRTYKDELAALDVDISKHNIEMKDEESLGRMMKRQREAGEEVLDAASDQVRSIFAEYGISLNLSRGDGVKRMNDEQFEAYKKAVAEYLDLYVPSVADSSSFEGRELSRKIKMLEGAKQRATGKARGKVRKIMR